VRNHKIRNNSAGYWSLTNCTEVCTDVAADANRIQTIQCMNDSSCFVLLCYIFSCPFGMYLGVSPFTFILLVCIRYLLSSTRMSNRPRKVDEGIG
jgi:hypothetical protein